MLFAFLVIFDAPESAKAASAFTGRMLLVLFGGGLLAFLIGLLAFRVVRHAAAPGSPVTPVSKKSSSRVSAWEEAGKRIDTSPPSTDGIDDGPGPWGAP